MRISDIPDAFYLVDEDDATNLTVVRDVDNANSFVVFPTNLGPDDPCATKRVVGIELHEGPSGQVERATIKCACDNITRYSFCANKTHWEELFYDLLAWVRNVKHTGKKQDKTS